MNLTPEEKKSQGKALSLREFAQAGGITYSLAIALSKEPGFPIFHGKIWWEDFVIWRRQAIQHSPHRYTSEDPQPGAGHTIDELVPKSDLQASLPPRAARLLAEVG